MPRKPGSFGDAALSALSVNEEKEKLRNELKLKEEALKRKSRSVKEKFNTSRVSATMSVASTVFSALGVEMYTSLQSACKNPANIRRLNNSGSFDVLFDDDKKILLAVIAEDRGVATRKELFPETYQDIWIELRPNAVA